MRVITGIAKGRQLKAPKGLATRPTTDRVKESLFNILGRTPEGAIVLDLFAGSGGLGIEALSRGADYAVLIDQSPVSCQIIRENLVTTNLLSQAAVYRNEVGKALEMLKKKGNMFTLIFSDPPYMEGLVEPTIRKVNDLKLVSNGSIFVTEHSRREAIPDYIGKFALIRRERYGDTTLSIYVYQEEDL
jgi:16S rRNA (guanine966-N2)-methyltransferase